ncbi:MAG: hypothetical protein FWG89_08975 [Treponema sp.]|nr:hypothetical protein [Treponema sp.]
MPWRLIQFIVVFIILLLFIVFNLENKSNISFGFYEIKDAPVFLTAFFSLIIGMFCAILFTQVFKPGKKNAFPKDKRKKAAKPDKRGENYDANSGHFGID